MNNGEKPKESVNIDFFAWNNIAYLSVDSIDGMVAVISKKLLEDKFWNHNFPEREFDETFREGVICGMNFICDKIKAERYNFLVNYELEQMGVGDGKVNMFKVVSQVNNPGSTSGNSQPNT